MAKTYRSEYGERSNSRERRIARKQARAAIRNAMQRRDYASLEV